jgi:hypothetical protein
MKNLDKAILSHTNLSMFSAIISLCESGSFYSGVGSEKAISKITSIAKNEMRQLVQSYDLAIRNERLKEQA